MACIYIMPFIPKHFSNCSTANLIRSSICRVYLHYSALLASITFSTWSMKTSKKGVTVYLCSGFLSGDLLSSFLSSFMHSKLQVHTLVQFLMWSAKSTIKNGDHTIWHETSKNQFDFSLSMKSLAKSPMISLMLTTAGTLGY